MGSLCFEGGSVEALLDAIQKTTGKRPSVIVSDEVKSIRIPSFEVPDVLLSDLFAALSLATDVTFHEKGRIWVARLEGIDHASEGIDHASEGIDHASPIIAVKPEIARNPREDPLLLVKKEEERKTTQPRAIGEILETFQVEDITTVILQTWESANERHGGRIAFHEDASLLILTGTEEEVSLADVVFTNLEVEARRRQTGRAIKDALETSLEALRKNLENLERAGAAGALIEALKKSRDDLKAELLRARQEKERREISSELMTCERVNKL